MDSGSKRPSDRDTCATSSARSRSTIRSKLVRDEMEGEGSGMGGWEIGEGVGWGALGFGDYLDAGLPVAKPAPNPYTTTRRRPRTEPVKTVWSRFMKNRRRSGQKSTKTKQISIAFQYKRISRDRNEGVDHLDLGVESSMQFGGNLPISSGSGHRKLIFSRRSGVE
jgi:hypothetical protein